MSAIRCYRLIYEGNIRMNIFGVIRNFLTLQKYTCDFFFNEDFISFVKNCDYYMCYFLELSLIVRKRTRNKSYRYPSGLFPITGQRSSGFCQEPKSGHEH